MILTIVKPNTIKYPNEIAIGFRSVLDPLPLAWHGLLFVHLYPRKIQKDISHTPHPPKNKKGGKTKTKKKRLRLEGFLQHGDKSAYGGECERTGAQAREREGKQISK